MNKLLDIMKKYPLAIAYAARDLSAITDSQVDRTNHNVLRTAMVQADWGVAEVIMSDLEYRDALELVILHSYEYLMEEYDLTPGETIAVHNELENEYNKIKENA